MWTPRCYKTSVVFILVGFIPTASGSPSFDSSLLAPAAARRSPIHAASVYHVHSQPQQAGTAIPVHSEHKHSPGCSMQDIVDIGSTV